jgi:hypothetical protein
MLPNPASPRAATMMFEFDKRVNAQPPLAAVRLLVMCHSPLIPAFKGCTKTLHRYQTPNPRIKTTVAMAYGVGQ